MKIQRREFIQRSGIAATGITVIPSAAWAHDNFLTIGGAEEILRKLSKLNDQKISDLLKRQVNVPGNRWNGGVTDRYELPNAHATRDLITVLGSAYASEYSGHYLSSRLENPINMAVKCLLNVQYEDGTIDLHSTNFHSTPDTAFIVNDLSPVYLCLKRLERPGLERIIDNLALFLSNAGKCLLVGGIHTANHRWVVSSALAWVNRISPSMNYVRRIDEWLSEGIDLDPDGQYTEKSVGAYSPVCDNAFLTMGRLLDRPHLLDVVRKNLDMSLYYIQPGGEVVTDASGRQDSAYTAYVNGYYYAYRYFSVIDNNPEYAAVCKLTEDRMPEKITRYLPNLLEDPLFKNEMVSAGKIPDDYFKRFEHSGVFRIRRGDADMTVIEDNPTFLSFRKGDAVMQSMRMAASFFGRGQFVSEDCTYDGDTIVLRKSITRGYYQPYPKDKSDGDDIWAEINREERELSEAQTLSMIVTIKESAGKVSVEADISGTPNVPVAWELSFRQGGELTGVIPDKNVKDAFFLEKGEGQYATGDDVITFREGTVTHKWSQMRGMLPKQDGVSVYVTGYTPFKHAIELS